MLMGASQLTKSLDWLEPTSITISTITSFLFSSPSSIQRFLLPSARVRWRRQQVGREEKEWERKKNQIKKAIDIEKVQNSLTMLTAVPATKRKTEVTIMIPRAPLSQIEITDPLAHLK